MENQFSKRTRKDKCFEGGLILSFTAMAIFLFSLFIELTPVATNIMTVLGMVELFAAILFFLAYCNWGFVQKLINKDLNKIYKYENEHEFLKKNRQWVSYRKKIESCLKN